MGPIRIGDNIFQLHCAPTDINLRDILSCATRSKDYANFGYAILRVSSDYFVPPDISDIKNHYANHKNNEHPDFFTNMYQLVPKKEFVFDEEKKQKFEQEYGTCSATIVTGLHDKKRFLVSEMTDYSQHLPKKYDPPFSDESYVTQRLKTIHCESQSMRPIPPRKKCTGHSKENIAEEDRHNFFLNYGKRGEKMQNRLDDEPNVLLEDFKAKYPDCGDATKDFLKLCSIIQKQEYFFHYMQAKSDVVLLRGNQTKTTCLETVWLTQTGRQLFCKDDAEECKDFSGITRPITYFGFPYSFFMIRAEDIFGKNSISFNISGAAKVWVIIPDRCQQKFQRALTHFYGLFGTSKDSCLENLNKKKIFIHLELLQAWGIDYTIVEQKAGEILITAAGVYHQGINAGYNLIVSVNFANPDWLMQMVNISQSDKSEIHRWKLLCRCKEIDCMQKWQIGYRLITNLARLMKITSIKNVNLTCNLRDFLHEKINVLLGAKLDFGMTAELFCFLIKYYVNCNLKKYLKVKSNTQTLPILSVVNGSTLDPHHLPYLIAYQGECKLYQTLKDVEDKFIEIVSNYKGCRKSTENQHKRSTDATNPLGQFVCETCASNVKGNARKRKMGTCGNSLEPSIQPNGVFASYNSLQVHLSRFNFFYVCMENGCDSTFTRRDRYMNHMQTCHRQNSIFCSFCSSWFDLQIKFWSHVEKCKSGDQTFVKITTKADGARTKTTKAPTLNQCNT